MGLPALKRGAALADACSAVAELTVKPSRRPGVNERKRRIEAPGGRRADSPAQSAAAAERRVQAGEQLRLAEGLMVSLAATGDIEEMARLLVDELQDTCARSLAALTAVAEVRDEVAASHSEQVAALAERVALQMSLSRAQARDVRHAALLHDIGKIAVPSAILLKPGPLTAKEWVAMRGHAGVGGELVGRIEAFAHLAAVVRASHERWDGAGYPDGLAGEAIPLPARIIAACDTYDAIVTDRPYRPARSRLHACVELLRVAGSQLDRRVVEVLVAELGLS